MGLPKRKLVFQPSIFRCYVSFLERMSMLCLWYCNSTQRGPPAALKSSTTASMIQRTLHLGANAGLTKLITRCNLRSPTNWNKCSMLQNSLPKSRAGFFYFGYVGLTQIQEFWKQIELPNGADEIYVCIGVKASNYFMPAETLSDKGPGLYAGTARWWEVICWWHHGQAHSRWDNNGSDMIYDAAI